MKKILVFITVIILILVTIIVLKGRKNAAVEYKIAEIETFAYVKYREGDSYGVMDRSGNIIIKAQYTNVEIPNPEKDIFVCYEDEKTTVFNSNKDELYTKYSKVLPIKLENTASLLCYEKTVLKYEKDGQYGLIDFDGKEITQNIYGEIKNLQGTEGKLLVTKEGKYGVINIKGTELVNPEYDKIQTDEFYNNETKTVEAGFIVSKTTDNGYRYGYINYKGVKLLDTEYNEIIRIAEKYDVYLIASKNGQFGLYKENKEIIKPQYQSISYTDNGAIIVERNGQFGIANLNGEIKTELKYNQIEDRGIYLYAQNAKENDVYNKEGEKIDINFNKTLFETYDKKYRIATLLNNNVTYYGIETNDGATLVDMGYVYIEYIYNNYFLAENEEGKYLVINANGKKELDTEYDLIQKIKDKNIIQASNKNDKKVDFYSIKLEKVISMDSARVENKDNYIKIYNEEQETKYLDKEGNELTADSEKIKKEMESEIPDQIGEYKKFQYSLDDAYYIK